MLEVVVYRCEIRAIDWKSKRCSRIATRVSVPRGAVLIRRNSSWRGDSTAADNAAKVDGPGVR